MTRKRAFLRMTYLQRMMVTTEFSENDGDAGFSLQGRAHWRRPLRRASVVPRGAPLADCIPCAIQALTVCSVILAERCFLCLYVVIIMGLTCSLNSRSLFLFCEGPQARSAQASNDESFGFIKEGCRDRPWTRWRR